MNDTEIVRLYFARSDLAIKETARKYGAFLNQVAYNILRCKEDSEEVVQDCYIRTWNSIPPQRPKVLKHFLSRVARNLALDKLDYISAKMRSADTTELVEELEDDLCSACGSAESEWEEKYIGELINKFLSARTAQERAIFIYRYFYSHTVNEIAGKMELPEHKIRYLLKGMRAELKNYLESEGISV